MAAQEVFMYLFGVVRETHAHDYYEVRFRFIRAKIPNILRYVICICVICISKKLKYLKNEAREPKTER